MCMCACACACVQVRAVDPRWNVGEPLAYGGRLYFVSDHVSGHVSDHGSEPDADPDPDAAGAHVQKGSRVANL
jgi:hypothetical protein